MNYQAFIGIDIGKYEFVVAAFGSKKTDSYANDFAGYSKFFKEYFNVLKNSIVVLETTGGHENDILFFLIEKNIIVHRADTRKVKSFIRSYGQRAKTDKIDAISLANYAQERHKSLKPFQAHDSQQSKLKLLEERRNDLKQMLVQEKNRASSPLYKSLKDDILESIEFLENKISSITKKIDLIIRSNNIFFEKKKILLEIPGIGEITANSMLALIPELGYLDRKTVASLCGLAPYPKQSGTRVWRSHTTGGRRNLRPVLFMAAMGARRTRGHLAEFYEKLVNNGKKKMIALVAVMRRIIVIANARLRDYLSNKSLISWDLLKS
jgi:transposase